MDLIIKIGIFMVFLVLFVGWIGAGYFIWARSSRRPLSSAGIWYAGLLAMGQIIATTIYVYLLARFFNGWLTVMLLLVAAATLILTVLIRAVLEARTRRVEELWEGFGIGVRTPGAPIAVSLVGLVVVAGYPVAVGIVYFTHEIPSPTATLWILGLTLLGLFLAGQLVVVLTSGQLLVSQYVEDDARKPMLVGRSLSLITGGVYLALTLYAFNVVRQGGSFSLEGAFGELNLALTVGLIIYFVATALIPYLVGSRRSIDWQKSFQGRREAMVAQLLEALALPGKAVKLERLEGLSVRLQEEESGLRTDPLVQYADAIDRGDVNLDSLPENVPEWSRGAIAALVESKEEFRKRDPRFQQLNWLDEFAGRLDAATQAIESTKTEKQAKDVASEWVGFYHQQRDEIAKRIAAAPPAKSRLAVAASFLVSTGIIGIVTGEVAKVIAERVSSSAGS